MCGKLRHVFNFDRFAFDHRGRIVFDSFQHDPVQFGGFQFLCTVFVYF